jgi:23S rRNA U2552 (ribose-2'-O)-methylase RlmE/FtsJ
VYTELSRISVKDIDFMNDLEKFFCQRSDKLINKWSHYFNFYDRYFNKYKNKPIKILEIGVYKGGSLQMWQDYFDKGSLIVGMDINNECINYSGDNIEIFIGDQSNIDDLGKLVKKFGNFDIIIDDGSHMNSHQIKTFEFLYDYVNAGGIYLVEDTHTSYMNKYKDIKETFTEYSKKIIDDLTAYHFVQTNSVSKHTKNTSGIHFHDSLVFFEKSESVIEKPTPVKSVGMKNKFIIGHFN